MASSPAFASATARQGVSPVIETATSENADEPRALDDESGRSRGRRRSSSSRLRKQALAAVRADVGDDCSRCKLHALGRSRIVFGVGNPKADLMFVGEAPGADEDLAG